MSADHNGQYDVTTVESHVPDVSEILAVISQRERVAERHAAAWQRVALIAVLGTLGTIGILVWQMAPHRADVVLVAATEDGRVLAMSLPSHAWTLDELQIRKHLSDWLVNFRGLTTDSVQAVKARNSAWEMSLPAAQKAMLPYFKALPLEKVGQVAVVITIDRLEPPPQGRTWEVEFTEAATNLRTADTEVHRYVGFVTIAIKQPEVIIRNGVIVTPMKAVEHLGVWIESYALNERPSGKKGGQ